MKSLIRWAGIRLSTPLLPLLTGLFLATSSPVIQAAGPVAPKGQVATKAQTPPVTKAKESTNQYGITMVDIPAGSFIMGSCSRQDAFMGTSDCLFPDSDASEDETPQHRVTVKAFQMSKTEVTLGQFKRYVRATGRTYLINDHFMNANAYGDDVPVVDVSWEDARDFIQWLNDTDGGGWRLPSEAEWEYACRANENRRFCTSAGDLSGGGWWDGNSNGRPHPVAQKTPNAFGLYDMSGNVREWVEDCRHENYRGAPTDGSAWTTQCKGIVRNDEHVLRGGFWGESAKGTRAASRGIELPGFRSLAGIRLARTR